jgi:RND family efflux transporter MFP subunit
MSTHRSAALREKKPTFAKGMVFIALIGIIIAVLTLAALTRRSAEGPLVPTKAPDALSVSVQDVQLSSRLILDEAFSGIVVARRTSRLGFSASGRISTIAVDVGDRVKVGQQLARLDTRDLQANLQAAQANIAEAEANYKLAEATVARQRTLFERGHVAQQRVDEAEAQASAAIARIEAAKAQAETIRVTIDLSAIRAPFDGVITNRMSDEGAIAMPGALLLELVEAQKLEARIGLPANVAERLTIGETYTLVSVRGEVPAVLRSMTGIIDQSLRTVTTLFDVGDVEAVNAGAVVRIALPREIDERGVWVPISSLSESSRGLWSIYIAENEGATWTAQPRLVEIVHTDGVRAFVRGTLQDGEKVIIAGLSRLVPGQLVRPGLAAPISQNVSDDRAGG